ncbi:hypothetical protein LCGC14_1963690 [marine sediment metagenome]|uniref:Uncharacterized protein n=1 Tax=marine sediment metagenome TaxID=412755 RepID=A0A0F9HS68_9ZZZZ
MEILIGLLVVVIVGELLRLRRRKNHEENKKPFGSDDWEIVWSGIKWREKS